MSVDEVDPAADTGCTIADNEVYLVGCTVYLSVELERDVEYW